MSVVGEVELGVVALPGSFAADLSVLGDKAGADAGRVAGASFIKTFSTALRSGGRGSIASMFGTGESAALDAGLSAGKAYSAGFASGVRTQGAAIPMLGTDAKATASAEASGLATGRAYSRGIAQGAVLLNPESLAGQAIGGARATASAEAAGVASGRAYSRGTAAGVTESEGAFLAGVQRQMALADGIASAEGRKAGLSFSTALSKGTLGAAAVIAGIFSIVEATKYNQQLALIQTQAGATAAAVAQIGRQTLDLAPKVGFGPEALAEAYYHAASAGFTLAQQQQLVASSSRGAQIGQADLEKTTQALIATTRSGIKGVSGMDDAMNILIRTVGIGDLRMPALVSALSTGIVPSAKSAGLSLEDVSAALAVFGDNVVPAQQAATRLRMTFSLLAAPSGPARDMLKQIGMSSDELATDLTKPQGLLVAIEDLHKHLDAAFPPNDGHKLTISEQRTALLEYTGTLKDAGISGKELSNDQARMAESLSSGTSSIVKQNQAIQAIFGGGRTSGAFLTLFEETDLLKQKYDLLGDSASRAAFAHQAWDKQQSLLNQQWKEFVASLDVGIIKIGEGLTPVAAGFLGVLRDIPRYLAPVGEGIVAVWHGLGDLGQALEPLGRLLLDAFGAAVVGALDAVGFVLRDVVGPALHGIADAVHFFDDNKAAAIGLASAIGVFLIPALVQAAAGLASLAIVTAVGAWEALTGAVAAAGKAVFVFAAENPLILGVSVAVGALAAVVTLLGDNNRKTAVDVQGLTTALKDQAGNANSLAPALELQKQILAWKPSSSNLNGIEYLKRYGVQIQQFTADLSDPANAHAWDTFIGGLSAATKLDITAGGKFGADRQEMADLQKQLQSTNPAVREFAQLWIALERDPSVSHGTALKLAQGFEGLNGAINTGRASLAGAVDQQKMFGKTVEASTDDTTALVQAVNTASKASDAVSKIDAAMRVTTDDALGLISTIESWNDKTASSAQQLQTAQQQLASANQSVADKQTAYNAALTQFGAGSDQAKTAYNDLQNAVQGVASATDAVSKAQPPSVDSILKRLGLDTDSLKKLSGATSQLIGEGITAPALSQLLGLQDPRAILAFQQGGKTAVDALNKAVGDFLNASGPDSFASLQTLYKKSGEAGVDAYIQGVKGRQTALTTAQDEVFKQSAAGVFSSLYTIADVSGRGVDNAMSLGMLNNAGSVLNALEQTFTGPQRDAVEALRRLAADGGTRMTQAFANSIAHGTPIVITKQQALKDGINAETEKILQSIGIHIFVDDQATQKIQNVASTAASFLETVSSFGGPGQGLGVLAQKKAKGGLVGHAAGGIVVGPGSGTSDSILGLDAATLTPTAFVSNGEFVVNANSTRLFLPQLEAINAKGLAAGGIAGSTPASTEAARPTAGINITLNIDKQLDTILRVMGSFGGSALLRAAEKYIGTPYTLGGDPYSNPFSSDCSGLVDRAYYDVTGQRAPVRTTYDMVNWGQTVPGMGAALPGDLLLMNYGEGGIPGPGHVGIYAAPNQMLHDPLPGGAVSWINIWETPGNIRRVLTPGVNSSSVAGGLSSPFGGTPTAGDFRQNGPVGPGFGPAAVDAMNRAVGLPAAEFDMIAQRESGDGANMYNSTPVGDSHAYGVYQVLWPANSQYWVEAGWKSEADFYDLRIGALAAKRLFDAAGGDSPWALTRDSGGPLPPGISTVVNGTGRNEWVLTEGQVQRLAGGGVVDGGVAAFLRSLATAAPQLASSGVSMVQSGTSKTIGAANTAIAAAVKEGNGPLAAALEKQLKFAEAVLYGTALGDVADKKVTVAEWLTLQQQIKATANVTTALTKMNTVNSGLVDSLKTFVSNSQQARDQLTTTLSTGAGFADLAKVSGSPAELRTNIAQHLSDVRAFASKITALKKRGYSDAVVRDVAGEGILNGGMYADMLLTASATTAKAVSSDFDALTRAETATSNSIIGATLGSSGITKASAQVYIGQAIFTAGANVDQLVSKAEYAQRTALRDSGGPIYPGQTLVDNRTGQMEWMLSPADTRKHLTGGGDAPTVLVQQENHYEGVDLPTAHAQNARDLSVALAKVVGL